MKTRSPKRFLAEKGLDDAEIDRLLQELPPQVPHVPPRTYPQPPPSNLPNLLAGSLKVLTWVAGSSVTLLLMYFRFLYPRLARSYHARHALQTHRKNLLERLTSSLANLKDTQTAMFSVLPQPDPSRKHSIRTVTPSMSSPSLAKASMTFRI
ncbi:hypothetical protein A0H81_03893 [Grifola frondosa]|uniref:Peroxisome membrane anchor protein Pex14p N-terminal domain-containing protein n=1 Tax=Grifola frondosa TaxID=5627 RepID=A0A1C7MI77_GRIFR|nr:hypothetical protein A0H81_03893 [Grifola frondosa]